MRRQVKLVPALVASLVLTLAPLDLEAADFGDIGVGAQVLIVNGDTGNETGFGVGIRARFLWIMGLEFSATTLESSRDVWSPSAYRMSLVIHAVQTKVFHLYLSPGLSGDRFTDAFNPVGDSTWFRVGGGMELRFLEGLALAADVHWTVPGEHQIDTYIDQYGEELLAEYMQSVGNDNEIPNDINDIPNNISTRDLLQLFPLDRFEFTVGLRYYFF